MAQDSVQAYNDEDRELIGLYCRGDSINYLADRFACSDAVVRQVLLDFGFRGRSDAALAATLESRGYRRTSCRHGIVSRIDRPDWFEQVSKKFHMRPAKLLSVCSREQWADFYRRTMAIDKLEVGTQVALLVAPSSKQTLCQQDEYVPTTNKETKMKISDATESTVTTVRKNRYLYRKRNYSAIGERRRISTFES